MATRLDHYLVSQKIVPSRSQGIRWIRDGRVLVNSKKVKAGFNLREGDVVDVTPPPEKPSTLIPESIPLNILHEDNDILVIDKEPSIVVHPGAGNWKGTLTHALLAHCGKLSTIGGVLRPGIVHRLDKGTSGVMVIAKNDAAHLSLSSQFKQREIEKIYWAFVYGRMKKREGVIEGFIRRSPSHRKKFILTRGKGKTSKTCFAVLKETADFSLVELRPETGRTHQIRVHLSHLGHSLVGDPLYGSHASRLKNVHDPLLKKMVGDITHPLLHARFIGFCHPDTGKKVGFTAPIPKDFGDVLGRAFGKPLL